jgi:predicted PhzF superfamily epimerase YddE/YHI9
MSGLPKLEYHLINAFTTASPHSGNQAAVVLFPANDPRATDDVFLLKTARDFGFAETAFLVPVDEEKGRWGLRWFTVKVVCHF